MKKLNNLPSSSHQTNEWPNFAGLISKRDNNYSSEKLPLISIVIPSFNKGLFIEETIRSIILQNYSNYELFIMDGGSTDETISVIKKYERWITYWVSEKDNGQSHAINKGWSRAKGDILYWINADDFLMPSTFWSVARHYIKNQHAGVIHGITKYIDHNYSFLRLRGGPFNLQQVITDWANTIAQPSAFISRAAYESVGDLDESLSMAMDFDYWLRIAIQFETVFIPEIWSVFRFVSGTKSATYAANFALDHALIVKKFFNSSAVSTISYRRSSAYANVYLILANHYYSKHKYWTSRSFLIRSICTKPVILFTKLSVMDLFRLSFGCLFRLVLNLNRIRIVVWK